MKIRYLFSYIMSALVALPLLGIVASAATIEVIETFDISGMGRNTEPQKINDRGDIVGAVVDPVAGVTRGFFRGRHGQFQKTFVEPNDTANLTQGRGINNAGEICGNYTGSDVNTHGYTLMGGAFTGFDLADVSSTIPLGINNYSEIAGSLVENDGVTQVAFLGFSDEAVTTFAVPDATATLAYQVNASNQATGYYVDGDGVTHGYLRDSDGTLTYPIDPDGSVGTVLFGNNDSNWVVGRYADADGITHGLFFMTPGEFVTFDFPGSAFTSLNGINARGYICGRYVDASGVEHGIIAKVDPNGTNSPNKNNAVPVTPLRGLKRSGIGMPDL